MISKHLRLLLGLCICLFPSLFGFTQEVSPNLGSDAADNLQVSTSKAYEFGELDQIDLFSGNLNIRIPIAAALQIGADQTLNLNLIYNLKPWDYATVIGLPSRDSTWSSATEFQTVARAMPSKTNNAGLGWRMAVGDLFPPHDPSDKDRETDFNQKETWLFVSPNGSSHAFYDTLGRSGIGYGDIDAPVLFSNDGAFLRLVHQNGKRIVQEPDGIQYIFGCAGACDTEGSWKLERIENARGLGVSVLHTTVVEAGQVYETEIFTDDFGREQTLYYQILQPENGAYQHGYRILKKIVFQSVEGQPAEYRFEHQLKSVGWGCHGSMYSQWLSEGANNWTVPLLDKVWFPDGTSYAFTYHTPSFEPSDIGNCADLSGFITQMIYPTGGKVSWEYGPYRFPLPYCEGRPGNTGATPAHPEGLPLPPSRTPNGQRRYGVTARSYYDLESNHYRHLGTRTFEPELIVDNRHTLTTEKPQQLCLVRRLFTNTVTDEIGNKTVSYFNVFNENVVWHNTAISTTSPLHPNHQGAAWHDREFGLPFTRYYENPRFTGAFLNSVVYDCSTGDGYTFEDWALDQGFPNTVDAPRALADSDCRVVRSSWVGYEQDQLSANPAEVYCNNGLFQNYDWECADSNRRMVQQVVYYHNDVLNDSPTYKRMFQSGYQWFGAFEQITDSSNFTSNNSDTRRRRFRFQNLVDDPNDADQRWILGLTTFEETHVKVPDFNNNSSEDHYQITRDFWNEYGERIAQRRYFRDDLPLTSGALENTADVVVLYGRDDNGFVTSERGLGGDRHPLPAGVATTALSGFKFRMEYSYQDGLLTSAVQVDEAQNRLKLYDIENDFYTGLARTRTDTAGVQTQYRYDLMGRLTETSRPGTPTKKIFYCLGTDTSPPAECRDQGANAVTTQRFKGSSLISSSTSVFDSVGRNTFERSDQVQKDGTVFERSRRFSYDPAGRLIAETLWARNGQAKATDSYIYTYDALGRRLEKQKPDGSRTRTVYKGDRLTRFFAAPNQSGGGDLQVIRTNYFDGLSRLAEISEYSDGDTPVQSKYGYDSGNRLRLFHTAAEVDGQTVVQNREADYDGLGNLRWESIPEWQAAKTYAAYDAMGNAATVNHGSRKLRFNFDGFGRPTTSEEIRADGSWRLIAETFYARINRFPDEFAIGNIVRAKRHNYVPINPANPTGPSRDHVVVSDYEFRGPGGLNSRSSTRVSILEMGTGAAVDDIAASSAAFEASLVYDQAGRIERFQYPDCLSPDCRDVFPEVQVRQRWFRDQITVQDRSRNGGAFETLARFEYHDNGMLARVAHANGVNDITLLDGKMMRPGAKYSQRGSTKLWESGDFVYDGLANLIAVGEDQFTYDRVNRLKEAWVAGQNQSVDYDPFGNITSLVSGGRNLIRPDEVDSTRNRLDLAGTQYNQQGDLQSLPGNQFLYDGLGSLAYRTVEVDNVKHRFSYVYDNNNHRICSLDYRGGLETWRLRDGQGRVLRSLERQSGDNTFTVKSSHYYGGFGLLAADFDDGSTSHYHLDHLASTRLITDASGNVTGAYRYYPFGELISAENQRPEGETFLFTGHERDQLTAYTDDDLDNMGARYYTPTYGRFLSVDPAQPEFGRPQSFNRYSYVLNNPVHMVDPDGEFWDTVLDAVGVGMAAYDFVKEPSWKNAGALALEVGAMAAPGIPSPRGLRLGAKIIEGAADAIDSATDAARAADNIADAARSADNISDTARATVNAGEATGSRTYQTYTKTHPDGRVYSGRTSGTGTPAQNITARDQSHHMNREGFGQANLDKSSPNPDAIRGREQQLIDAHGGAQSAGGTSGNRIRGIGPNNPRRERYLNAANEEFGQ